MESQKLDLNKLETKEGTLLIQHQTLHTPHQNKNHEVEHVSLQGTIKAPANFFTKRTEEIKNDKTHVLYNLRERKITLVTMEDLSGLGSKIVGELKVNPALKMLGINEEKTFFISEIVKHIRQNKFYFADEAEHKNLVNSLQNFSASVNAEIKKINNNNGNIEDVTKITMKSNLELRFNLLMPVFIGEENKKFNVEIACDATSSTIKFWFESTDLFELLELDTKSIIEAELARFNEEVVFIEQ